MNMETGYTVSSPYYLPEPGMIPVNRMKKDRVFQKLKCRLTIFRAQ